jgi:hypothetical protein
MTLGDEIYDYLKIYIMYQLLPEKQSKNFSWDELEEKYDEIIHNEKKFTELHKSVSDWILDEINTNMYEYVKEIIDKKQIPVNAMNKLNQLINTIKLSISKPVMGRINKEDIKTFEDFKNSN